MKTGSNMREEEYPKGESRSGGLSSALDRAAAGQREIAGHRRRHH